MMHHIDLGYEFQSGRTTIMLATLVGLGETGTLYVTFSQQNAAWARARSKHRVRCIGAGAFVREIGYWLSSIEYLALDDVHSWRNDLREEAMVTIMRERPLKLLMLAH